MPDRLTDRVYADFSAGAYQDPFEKLCAQLDRDLGDDQGASSPELELIPLFVSDGSVLDAHRLDARIAQLAHRYGPGYRITTAQLQLSEEPDYEALRSRVTGRLDHPEADPFYSPDFAVQLRSDYDSVSPPRTHDRANPDRVDQRARAGGAHPYAWEAYQLVLASRPHPCDRLLLPHAESAVRATRHSAALTCTRSSTPM